MREYGQGEAGHRAEVAGTQLACGRRDHEQERLAACIQPRRHHLDCLAAVTDLHLAPTSKAARQGIPSSSGAAFGWQVVCYFACIKVLCVQASVTACRC